MYTVEIEKSITQDKFDVGCVGEESIVLQHVLTKVGESIDDAMNKAWDELGLTGCWVNHCSVFDDDEMPYFYYDRLENDNMKEMSDTEIENWKQNKIEGFLASYKFWINEVIPVKNLEIPPK